MKRRSQTLIGINLQKKTVSIFKTIGEFFVSEKGKCCRSQATIYSKFGFMHGFSAKEYLDFIMDFSGSKYINLIKVNSFTDSKLPRSELDKNRRICRGKTIQKFLK